MADTKTLIEQAYSAFNKRDIDGALALMTEDARANQIRGLTRIRIRPMPQPSNGRIRWMPRWLSFE